ncbi:phage baseplate assembly protein [Chitinimonas prasina]|uniref:Phage baseplate assembly protein n=1 Tax=Chitinimonas prasina TaxID=1434937 RepID=A0ABQ5YJ07_9NEIS|nr:phage baseplate assembly protein V [Chitinimonas prasina]GLR13261.1 phage baseplate assembly protein [Chitinimonas prasina]
MDPTAELARRLESLIRTGTIQAVDHPARRCRVQTGQLLTDWLPWLEDRAGDTGTWNPPTVGEQVVLLCPSGDPATGIVLLGLPSDAKPTPDSSPDTHVTVYPDGARICYDHALGALTATGIKTALVDAADSIAAKAGKTITAQAGTLVTIDAPNTVVTGNLLVQKTLTYMGGMAGFGSAQGTGGPAAVIHGPVQVRGNVLIEGNLDASGSVMDAGGNSNHHSHP